MNAHSPTPCHTCMNCAITCIHALAQTQVEAKKQEFVTKGQQEKEAKANGTFRAPTKSTPAAAAAAASSRKEGAETGASTTNGTASEEQQQQQGEQQQQQPEEPPAANGNHAEGAIGDVSKPSTKRASRKGGCMRLCMGVSARV